MNRQDVENALPALKHLGAPLYIHAELVDMIAPKVRLWADSVVSEGAYRVPAYLNTGTRAAGWSCQLAAVIPASHLPHQCCLWPGRQAAAAEEQHTMDI